jgi:hypothetical protein
MREAAKVIRRHQYLIAEAADYVSPRADEPPAGVRSPPSPSSWPI